MVRVVIADDERLVRSATRRLLEEAGVLSVVGEAQDGRQALAAIDLHSPEVVILDLHMPGASGMEVLEEIVRRPGQKPGVIMLTAEYDERYARFALQTGAMGYVLKHAAAHQLVQAVHSVYQGRRFVSPEFRALLRPEELRDETPHKALKLSLPVLADEAARLPDNNGGRRTCNKQDGIAC